MNKKYNLKLDLQFRCNNSKMVFDEFDENTSDFFMQITRQGEKIDISNAIPTLLVLKPGGVAVSQLLEVKDNIIYGNLKNSLKDEVGTYIAKLMLVEGDKKTFISNISYEVTENALLGMIDDDIVEDERYSVLLQLLERLSNIELQEQTRIDNENSRIEAESLRQEAIEKVKNDIDFLVNETNKKVDNNLNFNTSKIDNLIIDTKEELNKYKENKDKFINEDLEEFKENTNKSIENYKTSKDVEINNSLNTYKTNTTNDINSFKNTINSQINKYKNDKDKAINEHIEAKELELDNYVEAKNKEIDNYKTSKSNELDLYVSEKNTLIDSKITDVNTSLNNKINEVDEIIDAINKEVESTTGRQVDLENTFDQLVINAGNSNVEIVDARVKSDGTSYSKLGDRLNEVDSQLAQNTNYIKARKRDNIYRLKELGCIHGTFKSIKEVFPNVTLEEVRLLDSTATLENSHVWYIIQKIMNDNMDTPATVVIDNFYYIDKTIQLTKSKTIIGESSQQDLFNSANNSVLYKIDPGDLFSVEKYSANNLYMGDFGAVGEKKDETAGDFLSIKRSLNGFTLKRLNVRIFKNGIRKYSGHTVCGLIDNCKFAYFADNGIHLTHLSNDSQTNQVTISNCAVHQYNTQNIFKYINNKEQIINEDYGNCICISGSGNFIDNVFIEDGICGINLTGQYKNGITVKGVYSETSNIADIYVPNTEYVNNQIASNAFKVIGTNYISRGIFIGDKKVENYEQKSADQLEDGYYPQNKKLLVKNNFTEIKIKFKSTYNLSNNELIKTYFYRTFNEIDRITATYNGLFRLSESFVPSDDGQLGVDHNTIFFSSCDIKNVSVDDINKSVTLYFYDSIKLSELVNLGYFRAQTDFVNGHIKTIFSTNSTHINTDNNSITLPCEYSSYRALCKEGNDISGYLYTWKNTSLNMYTSNVSIANGLVKKYEGVNEYIYEINVNKETHGSRLRSHCNYTPDFYSFEFPTGMTISDIAIYKK